MATNPLVRVEVRGKAATLDTIIIAVLVKRLGGAVTLTAEELAEFEGLVVNRGKQADEIELYV